MRKVLLADSDILALDDLIGGLEIPLTSLDLTPGFVNELSLTIPITGKESKARQYEEVNGSTYAGGTTKLQQSNKVTESENSLTGAQKQPTADGQESPTRLQKLQKRAAMHLPTSRPCTVHLSATYYPFTSQEVEAAQDIQEGRRPDLTHLSPRTRNILHGGMLYVNLIRAEGLSSHVAITKKFRVKVTVGPRNGHSRYKRVAERKGVGSGLDAKSPVFDETVDFLIDGDTVQNSDSCLRVEIWATHLLKRPSFKGSVTLALADIMSAFQMHDRWPLDGSQGSLEMRIEWQGIMNIQ